MSSWLPDAGTPLFILAMDHRASFIGDVFAIATEPTSGEVTRMRAAKSLIYAGLRQVSLPDRGRLGVLVDERYGAPVAEATRRDGVVLAMPIEKSGSPIFELEYGDRFAEHVAAFDPDFVKVLVRDNPDNDPDQRALQLTRLRALSDWAAAERRRWLFELLVPPTPGQLARSGGQESYDRDLRPALTAEVIAGFQAADVHPSIWKLEGYDTAAGAEQVLATVAAEHDHPAGCIVLGRDAPIDRVESWLRLAAPQPGYAGFAVGRTIWEQPLKDHLAGRLNAEQLNDAVARTYAQLIDTYITAQEADTSA
jgi:myo-inositol catabolism protein IolC